MNPSTLQAVSTFAATLAVVVAMFNLASQVRRHTQSLRSQNYARALDRLAAMQSRLSVDSTASRTFSKGVRDTSSLTREERIQFTWAFYELFGTFEFMFDEARRGTLPPHVWDRWEKTVVWWISMPGMRACWSARPTQFNPGFTTFVESCIETRSFDRDAAERWAKFLGS
jgi:K+-sensing histidine kinase KdpD